MTKLLLTRDRLEYELIRTPSHTWKCKWLLMKVNEIEIQIKQLDFYTLFA